MDRGQGERLELGDLSAWADLIRFKPDDAVLKSADRRLVKVRLQPIELGLGDINLDYYPIYVNRLPIRPGTRKRFTAEEFLEYFRLHIPGDKFMDPNVCQFYLYDKESERTIWTGKCAESAVLNIDMVTMWGVVNPDDGSVICSRHDSGVFCFSTVETLGDALHPVNGNREFGFFIRPGDGSTIAASLNSVQRVTLPQYVFFTRGADRVSDAFNYAISGSVFAGGHRLWSRMQRRFYRFVNQNGGNAVQSGWNISKRHDWATIKKQYFDVVPALDGAVGAAAKAAAKTAQQLAAP